MKPDRVPLPTRPATPAMGRFVRVNIGTLEVPRFRPAIVTEVWPGEFGEKKPPGLNVTIFLSGLNDRAALEEHFLSEGNHRDNAANQALKLCSCLLWHQTSLPHGLGRRDWSWPRPQHDVEIDMEAVRAAPVEQRAAWYFQAPFSIDWTEDKELAAYLEKLREDEIQAMKERDAKKTRHLNIPITPAISAAPVPEPVREAATENFGLKDEGNSDRRPEPDVAFDGKEETAPADLEDGGSDMPPQATPSGQPITP